MFLTIILAVIGGWSAGKAIGSVKVAWHRWHGGLFRPALGAAITGFFFLVAAAWALGGAWVIHSNDRSYDRAGAENVAFLGDRQGFDEPLLAYTDANTGKLCVGERVGGEEFLREIECIEPKR